MKAGEVMVKGQYLSRKGQIIEVKPDCPIDEFPPRPAKESVPYRCISSSGIGIVIYGWVANDYEIELLPRDKWIEFPGDTKAERKKKDGAFNVRKFIRANLHETDERIIVELNKMKESGTKFRASRSFEVIVPKLRKKVMRKIKKETEND
jgi:hypothetical protein